MNRLREIEIEREGWRYEHLNKSNYYENDKEKNEKEEKVDFKKWRTSKYE